MGSPIPLYGVAQCPYFELKVGFTGRKIPALAAAIIEKLPKNDDPGNYLVNVLTSEIKITNARTSHTGGEIFRLTPKTLIQLVTRLMKARVLSEKHLSALHRGSAGLELSLEDVISLKGLLSKIPGAGEKVNEIFRTEPWGSLGWQVEGRSILLSDNARSILKEAGVTFNERKLGYVMPDFHLFGDNEREGNFVPTSAKDFEQVVIYLGQHSKHLGVKPVRQLASKLSSVSQDFHLKKDQIRRIESLPRLKGEYHSETSTLSWGLPSVDAEMGKLLDAVEKNISNGMPRAEALGKLKLNKKNFTRFLDAYAPRDVFRPEDLGILSELSHSLAIDPVRLASVYRNLINLPGIATQRIRKAVVGKRWGKVNWQLSSTKKSDNYSKISAFSPNAQRIAKEMLEKMNVAEKEDIAGKEDGRADVDKLDHTELLMSILIENRRDISSEDYVHVMHALAPHMGQDLDSRVFCDVIHDTNPLFHLRSHHLASLRELIKENFSGWGVSNIHDSSPFSKQSFQVLTRLEQATARERAGMLTEELGKLSVDDFTTVVLAYLRRQNGKKTDLEVIRLVSENQPLSYVQVRVISKAAVDNWNQMSPSATNKMFSKPWGQAKWKLDGHELIIEGRSKEVIDKIDWYDVGETMFKGEGLWIDAETYTEVFVGVMIRDMVDELVMIELAEVSRRYDLSPEQQLRISSAIEYASRHDELDSDLTKGVWGSQGVSKETRTAMVALAELQMPQGEAGVVRPVRKLRKSQREEEVTRILGEFSRGKKFDDILELADLAIRKKLLQPSDFGVLSRIMQSAGMEDPGVMERIQKVAFGVYPGAPSKDMRPLFPGSEEKESLAVAKKPGARSHAITVDEFYELQESNAVLSQKVGDLTTQVEGLLRTVGKLESDKKSAKRSSAAKSK